MAFIAVSFFLLTGCQKDMQRDAMLGSKTSKSQTDLSLKSSALLKDNPLQLRSSVSSSPDKKMTQTPISLEPLHPQYRNMVNNALNLSATTCDDNTLVNQWLDRQLSDWNGTVIGYALDYAMLDLPQYYAMLFENSSKNQYFGAEGEYTHIINKTYKDLKRFWNIQTDNIVVVGMHGSTLRDREKLIKTYMNAFIGIDQELAGSLADDVLFLIDYFPQYRNGDHPIFTFNSLTQRSLYFPGIGVIPPKIIMGDGVMEAYTAIGFGDVAPQAILAHEFGHQVQFQLGVFGTVRSPEATRRTELMADAYSAYYLSHARGASMQWKRVQQFLQVFFNIGDCSITSTGHHGTPNQRMAAARWAYDLANDAQKQGHILSAQEFTALFEAALPQILKS